MKKPFFKTLSGKFVSRSVMVAVLITVVLGGLAITTLRSLNSTATESVDSAQGRLSPDAVQSLDALAGDISSAASRMTMLVIAILVLGAIAAGALTLVFARKVTTSIEQLRDAAMRSASALPEVVRANADSDGDALELPPIVVSSGDEIAEVAQSFNIVQQTAAGLAVDQARMAKQNSDRFVNLGRRSQNLLARQMNFIDAMEKDETNPGNLKRLFQIDHLATRMRRNAESVLVLADESSPRRLRGPVSMHQVVQAASGEIEHFDRIVISGIADATVEASVAHDLAHLLAELLENATSFAPPEAGTTVNGVATEDGYLLEIVDHGIGMEPDALAAANTLFADPSVSFNELSSPAYLGHDVVTRLAHRHGIRVELAATPTGGLTARLHLPQAALSTRDPLPPGGQRMTSQGFSSSSSAASPAGASDAGPFAVSRPVQYTAPATPDDDSSLQSFTPEVPDDASALVEATPPPPPMPTDFSANPAALDGLSAAVPDDASSLIDGVLDDASSLTDQPGPAPSEDVAAFDIPTFEDLVPPSEDLVPETDALTDSAPALEPAPDLSQAVEPAVAAEPEPAQVFEAAPAPAPEPAPEPVPTQVFEAAPAPAFEPEPTQALEPTPAPAPEPAPEPLPEPAQAFEQEPTPAPAPSTAASFTEEPEEWADRGLTPGQRAAIEWAMQKGDGRVSSGPVPRRDSPITELRPGPIDAAVLAGLNATPSGFIPRVRGEEGAKHFSPSAQAPRRATSTPNPEQLMRFREGIESGRAVDDGEDGR